MKKTIITLFISILFWCCAPKAETEFDIKAHYDKSEHKIAMRDGIKLHTVVYSPKDTSQKYPILMVRTPYSAGPYGPNSFRALDQMAPSDEFLEDGYIFVFQDGRGTFNSEGEWINLRPIRKGEDGTDESTDTYDTIEWLINNIPGNNGRVGQWGISHPGWYTVMGMIDAHPALKAASPQATTFDAFIGDDDHHNGAYVLLPTEWWYSMSIISGPDRTKLDGASPESIDYGTPWAYEFFLNAEPIAKFNEKHFNGLMTQVWQDIVDHPDYDEFWQSRNVGRWLDNIKIPVLNVGGWFDACDPYGAIATYQTIEEKNLANKNTLVFGPWRHGGWRRDDGSKHGDIPFGSKTSEYFQKDIIFPFFQYYLKDAGSWSPSEATVFETGNNRWHHFEQWPPQNIVNKNIYFQKDGGLSFDKPKEESRNAHDGYISDPAKPVPFLLKIRMNPYATDYIQGDQRYASTRPDVLVYQSEVLDKDITIAGPIMANLFASTSGTDSDWFVKLIDVYPYEAPDHGDVEMGGYQMMVGIEVMRGKYRNSLSDPEPMTPDLVTPISFEIRDRFHTFKKGHRIMVHVHSSFFPAFDRNPQKFTNIYRAKESDYQKATQKIYRSQKSPSHLVLPILEQ
jgi:putative CocE/NonD family hydrolase